MANFVGSFVRTAEKGYRNELLTVELSSYKFDYWPPSADVINGRLSGPFANKLPVVVRSVRAFSGDIRRDAFLDYYMRIRVTPTVLDLGNLASEQTRSFFLWNAFLNDVTVTDVQITSNSGLVLIPPVGYDTPPYTLKPLKNLEFKVTATLNGPASINASVVFTTSAGRVSVQVVGTRLVVFPFGPDWQIGVQETLTARSVLVRSANGTEQTVSYRRRLRRSFVLAYTLKGAAAQMADNLLFAWQSNMYGLPLWTEQALLASPIAAGATTVFARTANRTFVVGSLVHITHPRDYTAYESRQIIAVSATQIEVSSPFANNWPAGSLVVPLVPAAINPQMNGTRHTSRVQQFSAQFDCDPLQTDPNTPVVAPAQTYEGYEVTPNNNNWRDGVTFTYNSDVQRMDMQTGLFRLRTQTPYSGQGRSFTWTMKSHSSVSDFRAWLRRRQGKTFATWMQSGFDDFTCAGSVTNLATTIPVKRNGYANLSSGNDARNRLFIKFRNGNTYIRKIVAANDTPDGLSVLQLDQSLGFAFGPKDVLSMSILNFYRMAEDQVTIDWKRPGIAESTLALVATRKLPNG